MFGGCMLHSLSSTSQHLQRKRSSLLRPRGRLRQAVPGHMTPQPSDQGCREGTLWLAQTSIPCLPLRPTERTKETVSLMSIIWNSMKTSNFPKRRWAGERRYKYKGGKTFEWKKQQMFCKGPRKIHKKDRLSQSYYSRLNSTCNGPVGSNGFTSVIYGTTLQLSSVPFSPRPQIVISEQKSTTWTKQES